MTGGFDSRCFTARHRCCSQNHAFDAVDRVGMRVNSGIGVCGVVGSAAAAADQFANEEPLGFPGVLGVNGEVGVLGASSELEVDENEEVGVVAVFTRN